MPMMYQAYQNHMDLTSPWRTGAAAALKYLNLVPQGMSDKLFGRLAASLELISRSTLTYHRPAYGIDKVLVGNQELEVTEEVTFATPFGSLLHFKKENSPEQPRLLLVAPMSGHFATLLRGTVKTLLQDHDVYITDWHNPRDIPLQAGRFGLEDYTDHLITFLDKMGPRSHMVAICQPSVSALAAAAVMSEDNHPARPATLTLMAGPIDTRNPADQGQRIRQEQADRMVHGQFDQLRAGAVQGRVPPGLSRLRAAHGFRVDEPRTPHQAAHRSRQSSGQGREGEGGSHQDLLRRIFRRDGSAGGVLHRDRARRVPGASVAARQADASRPEGRPGDRSSAWA